MAAPKKQASRSRRRSSAPPPTEIKNPFLEFFRNLSMAWVLIWAAGFGTVAGAIFALDKLLPIVEPWWYTSRGHLREYTPEIVTKKVDPIARQFEEYVGTTEPFRIKQTIALERLGLINLQQNLELAKKEAKEYPLSSSVQGKVLELERDIRTTVSRIGEAEMELKKIETKTKKTQ